MEYGHTRTSTHDTATLTGTSPSLSLDAGAGHVPALPLALRISSALTPVCLGKISSRGHESKRHQCIDMDCGRVAPSPTLPVQLCEHACISESMVSSAAPPVTLCALALATVWLATVRDEGRLGGMSEIKRLPVRLLHTPPTTSAVRLLLLSHEVPAGARPPVCWQ